MAPAAFSFSFFFFSCVINTKFVHICPVCAAFGHLFKSIFLCFVKWFLAKNSHLWNCLFISLPPFISPVVDMLRPVGPINKCTLCWWQWVVNAVQRPPVLACSIVLCSYNLFCRGNTGQIKENVKGEVWRMEWMLAVLVTVQEYLRNAFSLCWKPRFEDIILEIQTSYAWCVEMQFGSKFLDV